MAQQLKRWESPRRSGRNHKGQGGSARARQLKKQQKRLLKRLKASSFDPAESNQKGEVNLSLYFWESAQEAA
ncbi:hypothetical protein C7271_13225 [filamentous cyanobacterium CCP5]|nr:hypothetical protein C7271_13225 [filamentous cyanobacterium CCP5]